LDDHEQEQVVDCHQPAFGEYVAKTIFDSAHGDALLGRLDRLTPDARAQWGKLTAPRMICHLSDSLRVATGEVPPLQA